MKEHVLPLKTVVTLNLVESGLWKKGDTYKKEVKEFCEAMSDSNVYEIRDAFGILLFSGAKLKE